MHLPLPIKLLNGKDVEIFFVNIYVLGLSYNIMKSEEIRKEQICALFTDPIIKDPLLSNSKRFPTHWCNHDAIKSYFWNRWWMVFDKPSCNRYDVSLYFRRKLYYEFILNQMPSYFDMMVFQGRGEGFSQDRPRAQ